MAKRKIVCIDEEKCNGCGQCVSACAEGAIELRGNKAHLVAEKYCDGLAACLGTCPKDAISIIERDADDFDPEAVETYLSEKRSLPRPGSELTHWPVQIKLVPPTAPFLKNADLLVASDCTPAAYPAFHEDLLKGKVLMIGCPKFDDTNEYVDRFTQIFAVADIKTVTVAIMEVPCCSKMPVIIRTAMQRSGRVIPMNVVIINSKGEIVRGKESFPG